VLLLFALLLTAGEVVVGIKTVSPKGSKAGAARAGIDTAAGAGCGMDGGRIAVVALLEAVVGVKDISENILFKEAEEGAAAVEAVVVGAKGSNAEAAEVATNGSNAA
jgi:hypothetical protein